MKMFFEEATLFLCLYFQLCFSLIPFPFRLCKRSLFPLIRMKALSAAVEIDTNSPKFDPTLSILLAGYAFEAYNTPYAGKSAIGLDGTAVIFTSVKYIRQCFDGVLLITVLSGHIGDNIIKEQQALERLISGNSPDPYVQITVQQRNGPNGATTRILDRMLTTVQPNTRNPIWRNTGILYVFDPPQDNIVNLAVFDKNYLKGDDQIGFGSLNLKDLISHAKNRYQKGLHMKKESISELLPVPIYANKTENINFFSKLLDSKSRSNRFRSGTIEIHAEYIPWDWEWVFDWESFNAVELRSWFDNIEQSNPLSALKKEKKKLDTTSDNKKSSFPRGASPKLLDWGQLLSEVFSPPSPSNQKVLHHELGGSLSSGNLEQLCSLDNADTDTQASIWADFSRNSLIISFRGTETVRYKDILIDLNLFQAPFLSSLPYLSDVKIHQGFLQAYKSVQDALLQQIMFIFKVGKKMYPNKADSPWKIYATGHSLGGALATLLTFDLARIKAGYIEELSRERPQSSSSYDVARHYVIYDEFSVALRNASICCYTYGAPRVGNTRFKEIFDELVNDCFRVVNQRDIVARMPRSSKTNIVLDYEHVGKTVMIDEECQENSPIWIEGESLGPCPLSDIAIFSAESSSDVNELNYQELLTGLLPNSTTQLPDAEGLTNLLQNAANNFTNSLSLASNEIMTNISLSFAKFSNNSSDSIYSTKSGGIIANFPQDPVSAGLQQIQQLQPFYSSASSLWKEKVEVAANLSTSAFVSAAVSALNSQVSIYMEELSSKAAEASNHTSLMYQQSLQSIPSSLDLTSLASNVTNNLNSSDFVRQELQLWASIADGTALAHHLEPSYYAALLRVMKQNTSSI